MPSNNISSIEELSFIFNIPLTIELVHIRYIVCAITPADGHLAISSGESKHLALRNTYAWLMNEDNVAWLNHRYCVENHESPAAGDALERLKGLA